MREIKFRAWDVLLTMQHPKPSMRQWKHCQIYCMDRFDDITLEWMQYTGLKDKNKTEIYEGDIVKGGWDKINYVVEWTKETYSGNPQYHPMNKNGAYQEYYGDWEPAEFEIIGNIYENPELLNK